MPVYNPGGGSGGGTGSAPTVSPAGTGNLGATQTLDFGGVAGKILWLQGTVNLDLVVSLVNRAAGCYAEYALTMGATPRAFSVDDGLGPQAVTIKTANGDKTLAATDIYSATAGDSYTYVKNGPAESDPLAVLKSIGTTKGDTIFFSASGTPVRQAVPGNGQAIIGDSTQTDGVTTGTPYIITANTQTASYTLVLADAGKSIEMNLGTATVLTVPPNSSVAFPTGTVIEVVRLGAGSVTIAQGSGVVLRNRLEAAGTTNRTLTSQYSNCSIRKRGTDEWILVGDIA